MPNTTSSTLQIENLFKKSFEQTKSRFFTYLFVYVIGLAIALGTLIALVLVGGALFLVYSATKMTAVLVLLGVVVGAGFIAALVYLGAWIQLTVLSVMTSKEKMGVNQALRKSREIVPGYIWLLVLSGLFIFGLVPFGILSIFAVILIWAIWGSMAGFVYLYQKQPRGIMSLWISRDMIRGSFWKVAGRLLLITLVINVITGFFSWSRNSFLSAMTPLVSILAGPFFIAYIYEIYKGLKMPKKVQTPNLWIVLSVVGWVVMLVVFIAVGAALSTVVGEVLRNSRSLPLQIN